MNADYRRAIFLNYPYDNGYVPIVDAIIFSALACGFEPRSAEETVGGLELRVERIVKLIEESAHGIHDISASTSKTEASLRLNMPFELGVFYGAKRLGSDLQRGKTGFIFDSEPDPSKRALSDTAGLDLQIHKGQPSIALICVQRYLKKHATWNIMGPASLIELYDKFLGAKPKLCTMHDFILDDLSFEERRGMMALWLSRRAQKRNR